MGWIVLTQGQYVKGSTPPKFNIEPENDAFQMGSPSSGSMSNFRGVPAYRKISLLDISSSFLGLWSFSQGERRCSSVLCETNWFDVDETAALLGSPGGEDFAVSFWRW